VGQTLQRTLQRLKISGVTVQFNLYRMVNKGMSKIPPATVAVEIDQDRRRLLIDWNDGRRASYPYIWLRHACFFPLMGRAEQLDPRESRLPEDPASLSIASTALDANALIIHWAHDEQPT